MTARTVFIAVFAFCVAVFVSVTWLAILAGAAAGVLWAVGVSTLAHRYPVERWGRFGAWPWWIGAGLLYTAAEVAVLRTVGGLYGLTGLGACLAVAVGLDLGAGRRRPSSTGGTVDLAGEIDAEGWPAWSARHELTLLGQEPDPSHPGHSLRLYGVPGRYGPFRVAVGWDGSLEGGVREEVAVVVPARYRSPVAAMAASYGVPVEVYRLSAART